MVKDTKKRKKFDPESIIQNQIVEIDGALEQIERRMRPYEELNSRKLKLLAARRALLTDKGVTGNAGTRLTVDDVAGYFSEHPGATASQAAERFGVAQTTVSSHIYRNKERFIKKNGGYWARDPEAGLDTADDIEEDDE